LALPYPIYLAGDPNEKRWSAQLFQALKPEAAMAEAFSNATFGARRQKSLISDNLTAKRFAKPSV
jgi:hypothetical protein